MKQAKLLITVALFLASVQFCDAQKTELHINASSGLFSFNGAGASSNTYIITYPFGDLPANYTVNPYGSKKGFSYSGDLQAQRVTNSKNLYGIAVGYEVLVSRIHIRKVGVSGDPAYLEYPANGQTKLQSRFITINPFVGHRFALNNMRIDLVAGSDLAFCLKSEEEADAIISNKEKIHFISDREKPAVDFRPRLQVKVQLNKLGILTGYSLGLTNYQTAANSKAFSSLIRLGVSYQLR